MGKKRKEPNRVEPRLYPPLRGKRSKGSSQNKSKSLVVRQVPEPESDDHHDFTDDGWAPREEPRCDPPWTRGRSERRQQGQRAEDRPDWWNATTANTYEGSIRLQQAREVEKLLRCPIDVFLEHYQKNYWVDGIHYVDGTGQPCPGYRAGRLGRVSIWDIRRHAMEAAYSTLIVIALMIAMAVFGLMRPDLAGSWYGIGWIVLFLGLAMSSGRVNVLSDHFRYRTYVPGYSGQTPAEERNERLAVFAVMFALAFLFRGKGGKDT